MPAHLESAPASGTGKAPRRGNFVQLFDEHFAIRVPCRGVPADDDDLNGLEWKLLCYIKKCCWGDHGCELTDLELANAIGLKGSEKNRREWVSNTINGRWYKSGKGTIDPETGKWKRSAARVRRRGFIERGWLTKTGGPGPCVPRDAKGEKRGPTEGRRRLDVTPKFDTLFRIVASDGDPPVEPRRETAPTPAPAPAPRRDGQPIAEPSRAAAPASAVDPTTPDLASEIEMAKAQLAGELPPPMRRLWERHLASLEKRAANPPPPAPAKPPAPPPRPMPPPPSSDGTLTEDLIRRVAKPESFPDVGRSVEDAARRLCELWDDHKSLGGFRSRLRKLAADEIPLKRMLRAFRKAKGAGVENPGALFMAETSPGGPS